MVPSTSSSLKKSKEGPYFLPYPWGFFCLKLTETSLVTDSNSGQNLKGAYFCSQTKLNSCLEYVLLKQTLYFNFPLAPVQKHHTCLQWLLLFIIGSAPLFLISPESIGNVTERFIPSNLQTSLPL